MGTSRMFTVAAWLNMWVHRGQATTGLRHLPIRPWAGLGVLAGWSAAALLAGALLLRPRDA